MRQVIILVAITANPVPAAPPTRVWWQAYGHQVMHFIEHDNNFILRASGCSYSGSIVDLHMAEPGKPEIDADCWSDWLLSRRHGGDPEYEPILRVAVEKIRDRVLDGAKLTSGMKLLDVGAGDGLISFEALRRIEQPFSVLLSDISLPLLKRAECIADHLGFRPHCSFMRTPAETLAGVADASFDVLTSRAVLAYVHEKPSALRNFLRVLKPGGRLSLGEPIGQDAAVQLAALTNVVRSGSANFNTAYLSLLQRCRALQMPSDLEGIRADPFTNFSERDLVRLIREAGFINIHMEFHMDVKAGPAIPWSTFIDIAPRPGTLTLREICEEHLTIAEVALLESGLRAAVEEGKLTGESTNVFLTAEKEDFASAQRVGDMTL